jgi:glutamate dehydrogenase
MSGDVFGNGMLLSEHIKLVAAFNHLHIFVDPNPDAAASFKERKRLFELPRSSWTDYDTKLISKGGLIFDRSEKSLTLSKEIQEALGFHQDTAAPDELISAILKSPVDLLWNGGIGTYVKSSLESNETVGDRSNDSLRVNGKELRCKVIGEGGNLGCTQRGRIEYSLNGGAINTDFIDNSAGVDCSDHEVNIKIAFEQAIENGNLKAENRDALLASMTDEVAELVLVDNYVQAQSLTSTQSMGVSLIDHQQRLIHSLELSGLLKRDIEFLPNDDEIATRKASGKGLTRPELAVLLSYSKIDMYDNLLNSNLPDDEYLTKDLFGYFPKDMQDKFPDEIMNHQLKRNIIANEVTNSFVNRMGSRCFKSIMENTGLKGCDIARSYIIVRDLFNLDVLWGKVKLLQHNPATNKGTMRLTLEIQRFVSHQMMWLLRTQPQPLDMTGIVSLYQSGVAEISECILDVMSDSETEVYNERVDSYKQDNIPDDVASQIALLSSLSFAYDIIKLTHKNNIQIVDAGEIYFALKQNLGINWLRNAIDNLVSDGYWNKLSIQALSEDLNIQLTRLALDVISNYHNNDKCDGAVNRWVSDNSKQIDRFRSFIDDLKSLDNIDFSMLMIAIKRVESIKVE